MKKIYLKVEAALPAIIFSLIFIVMMINIITRELSSNALDWPIELSRYALVWLTFLGSVYLFRTDQHIRVDAFWNYLRRKINPTTITIIEIIKLSVIIFFSGFFSYYGYIFSERLKFFSSPSLNISQSYLYMIVPISGVFITLITLFKIYKTLKKGSE
ncbi:TRAP transporter small permease [Oceanisphaera pacifica]|uniref:TRAP transporter small permease protein n=1 Tax=Oceanisphaera pacifica TaxID=2818389 RepID=A0ABS3NJF3_9GAMM|nr:TRAP transporter small permease [Oceanisphaera pacifica]MBO1520707.1 TRAP transporter small permease [Oceanisphaera pacifica]